MPSPNHGILWLHNDDDDDVNLSIDDIQLHTAHLDDITAMLLNQTAYITMSGVHAL